MIVVLVIIVFVILDRIEKNIWIAMKVKNSLDCRCGIFDEFCRWSFHGLTHNIQIDKLAQSCIVLWCVADINGFCCIFAVWVRLGNASDECVFPCNSDAPCMKVFSQHCDGKLVKFAAGWEKHPDEGLQILC